MLTDTNRGSLTAMLSILNPMKQRQEELHNIIAQKVGAELDEYHTITEQMEPLTAALAAVMATAIKSDEPSVAELVECGLPEQIAAAAVQRAKRAEAEVASVPPEVKAVLDKLGLDVIGVDILHRHKS